MGYLIALTAVSSCLYLLLRVSDEKGARKFNVLFINYLLSLTMAAVSLRGTSFPTGEANGPALGIGAVNGALYLISLVLMQTSIRRNGMIATSTFSRLGVLIPILLSLFLFKERPSAVQLVGVGIAVAAIFIMQWKPHGAEGVDRRYLYLLFLQLVVSGFSNAMSKIYSAFGAAQYKNWFVFYSFLLAAILCGVCRVVKKEGRISGKEALFGLGIGTVNYLSAQLTLQALYSLPSYIVYPVTNAGALVLVSLASVLLWKDKVSRRQVVGIVLICCAVALMNI